MIIDFHTHIFPDAIAEKTISHLEKMGGIKAHLDGTLASLKASMKKSNIDYSVVLPVVTKPSQFKTVNQYAFEINGKDGIISFGGIHPGSTDFRNNLKTIKSLGLKGIKLHPDYQGTSIDDIRYLNIIDYALYLDLIVVLHAGMDISYPNTIHCPPKKSILLVRELAKNHHGLMKLVFAHTGGYAMWDEVEEYLVGSDVYFDISFTLEKIESSQLLRIIRNHGSEKILFASDSPWGNPSNTLAKFLQLELTNIEKECILSRNALRLLYSN